MKLRAKITPDGPLDRPTELYASQLNCSISCFWDSNWDVKLGDELNGFVAEGNFRTVDEVAEFLHAAHWRTSRHRTMRSDTWPRPDGSREGPVLNVNT